MLKEKRRGNPRVTTQETEIDRKRKAQTSLDERRRWQGKTDRKKRNTVENSTKLNTGRKLFE